MMEAVITKNGWGDDCVMSFEDKVFQYIRLFLSRKEAEGYVTSLCKFHGYVEIYPWEVWCVDSSYSFK